jgi:sigma-B regulation protein RsbU (phosphoserine phosphatase)
MCVALDAKTGRASVVGAGHPPLLIGRLHGGFESIGSIAPPLGLVERAQLSETVVDLAPGDVFLLYTDGLFGGSGGERGRLTPQRVGEMLDAATPSAEELLGRILDRTGAGDGKRPPADDVTAIVVRRAP